MDARSTQFSENSDNPHSAQLIDEDSDEYEDEGDEAMDGHFGHLFDLAEAAHLVDIYHTDRDIVPFLDDITPHEGSIPNISPRKRSRL